MNGYLTTNRPLKNWRDSWISSSTELILAVPRAYRYSTIAKELLEASDKTWWCVEGQPTPQGGDASPSALEAQRHEPMAFWLEASLKSCQLHPVESNELLFSLFRCL